MDEESDDGVSDVEEFVVEITFSTWVEVACSGIFSLDVIIVNLAFPDPGIAFSAITASVTSFFDFSAKFAIFPNSFLSKDSIASVEVFIFVI